MILPLYALVENMLVQGNCKMASKFLKGLRWNKMTDSEVGQFFAVAYRWRDKLPDFDRILEKAVETCEIIK